MNLVNWLVIGVVVGFLGSWRLNSMGLRRVLVDVILGGAGALAGGMLVLPAGLWFSADTDGPALLASLAGAMLLLALAHLRSLRDRHPG